RRDKPQAATSAGMRFEPLKLVTRGRMMLLCALALVAIEASIAARAILELFGTREGLGPSITFWASDKVLSPFFGEVSRSMAITSGFEPETMVGFIFYGVLGLFTLLLLALWPLFVWGSQKLVRLVSRFFEAESPAQAVLVEETE